MALFQAITSISAKQAVNQPCYRFHQIYQQSRQPVIEKETAPPVLHPLALKGLTVFLLLLCLHGFSQQYPSAVERYVTGPYYDGNGSEIIGINVPGIPPAGYRAPSATLTPGAVVIANIPAYDWSFGCAPTAAAMAAGYYDNTGYPDVYQGPSNGGMMPMDNTLWGTVTINGHVLSQCPLSATRQGLDGRITRGHTDDYWIYNENGDPDPYIVNNWPQHPSDSCTGDFMGSNQSAYGNPDGASTFFLYTDGAPLHDFTMLEPNFRDGCHGLKLFYESRGYQIVENYSQMIMGYNGNVQGFTFQQYMEEIDNGRPVMIHVAGHTMLGFGYDETGQIVFLHDTWDHSLHSMTWAGSYAGRQHFGITVIRLQSDVPPPLAAFEASQRLVEPGESITFTDLSSGTPTSWSWVFEGGTPSVSSDQHPVVTYHVPGIYSVTLVATNAVGYDTETRTSYISVSHCYAAGDCEDYITEVRFGCIENPNNSCGTNGYSDYRLLTASLVPGRQYGIQVFSDSIIVPDQKCGIWFDWNRDNVFTDPGEFTALTPVNGTNQFSGFFTASLSAQADNLFRMRIRVIRSGELTPCGPADGGETEDYTIHLLKPEIFVTPDYLDFGNVIRFDCSSPLPYSVSAHNLSSPMLITASPDMQVSFYPDHGFSSALSIPPVNDSIAPTTIYARFCIYWTTGETEYIYHNSPGAATRIVTLHATEYIPPPAGAPVVTIGNVLTIADTTVRVPVTVTGFHNIQFGYMNIQYDSKVLVFTGIENIHPELDWWWIDGYEYPVSGDLANLNIYLDGNENARDIPDHEKLFDLVFTYAHGSSAIAFDTTNCGWDDAWYRPLMDVPAEDFYIPGSIGPSLITLKLNLFLESLFDETLFSMRKARGDNGDQFPGTVADLITIRLASATPPYDIIETIGNIPLHQNGNCRFFRPLSFSGEYYIVIKHRNSIETWTSEPVLVTGDYIVYDFTEDVSRAFGNNLKLVGGEYCIYAGDVNLDGVVDIGDMTLVDNDSAVFYIGYTSTDVSGDGIVDINDFTIIDNNSMSFTSVKKP